MTNKKWVMQFGLSKKEAIKLCQRNYQQALERIQGKITFRVDHPKRGLLVHWEDIDFIEQALEEAKWCLEALEELGFGE